MLSPEEIIALTPVIPYRPRTQRYRGDAVTISIQQMPDEDVAILSHLYGFLQDLYSFLTPRIRDPEAAMEALKGFLEEQDYETMAAGISRFGTHLQGGDMAADLRKVYHDIRSGSMSALLLHLDLIPMDEALPEDVERLFILSRDHLKIIRNGVPDLDVPGTEADLIEKQHSIDLLREKWAETAYKIRADGDAGIHFHCDFDGAVSECCMEFSALDRVIYNLVNNAAKYAADRQVHLHVLPLQPGEHTNLRFVVANRISPQHRQTLVDTFQNDLSQIFKGGFTTGGHGIGMRICGDFVTHGFELNSLQQALDGGYLGATLCNDAFVAWFHWPGTRH